MFRLVCCLSDLLLYTRIIFISPSFLFPPGAAIECESVREFFRESQNANTFTLVQAGVGDTKCSVRMLVRTVGVD